jgi:hypothetical protein
MLNHLKGETNFFPVIFFASLSKVIKLSPFLSVSKEYRGINPGVDSLILM